MTHLIEGGLTPQLFVERFKVDPEEIRPQDLPARASRPAPPTDLTVTASKCIDLQDSKARLWNEPEGAETRGDAAASDGLAVWMPGTHHEWAFQMLLSKLPASALAAVGSQCLSACAASSACTNMSATSNPVWSKIS